MNNSESGWLIPVILLILGLSFLLDRDDSYKGVKKGNKTKRPHQKEKSQSDHQS
jgi:hypothetical protein